MKIITFLSNKIKNDGQSLVEMMVALGVTALVLVTLISVMITGLYNTNLARQRTSATDYVNEAVDWIRQERDRDWSAFYSRIVAIDDGTPENYLPTQGYCLPTLDWTYGGGINLLQANPPIPCTNISNTIPNTQFFRYVQGEIVSTDEVEVLVVVRWFDSKGKHEAQSSIRLTSWESVQ